MYNATSIVLFLLISVIITTITPAEEKGKEFVTEYPLEAYYVNSEYELDNLPYYIRDNKKCFRVPDDSSLYGFRIELSPYLSINSKVLNEIEVSGSTALAISFCDSLFKDQEMELLVKNTIRNISMMKALTYWNLSGDFEICDYNIKQILNAPYLRYLLINNWVSPTQARMLMSAENIEYICLRIDDSCEWQQSEFTPSSSLRHVDIMFKNG